MAQQEVAIGCSLVDMELPHNLAKQALEATGRKSTLKATKWILDRRAEVQQQQHFLVAESQNDNGEEEHEKNVGKELGEEEIGSSSVLPISSLWGCSLHGASFGGGILPDPIPVSMDRPVSGAVERPVSIGSSSPLDRPNEFGEGQTLQTSVKLARQSNTSCSPEPDEGGKIESSKFFGVASARQLDTICKRKRQDETDTSHARPLAIVQSIPWPIAMRTGKGMTSMADRMRPTSIAEILGQDHLLGQNCVLRSLLDNASLPSIVFGGPPGSGKTSLARLIARSASCRFVSLSSAMGGIAEVQEILDEAKQARKFGQRTVLFVETLSRFEKSQQECMLPSIEAGYVIFIGATTENPSTEMISGLLLRCRVFTLKKLHPDHLCTLMKRAISDKDRGVLVSLGDVSGLDFVAIEDEVIQFLADAADGDARVALNGLEAAVLTALGKAKGASGFDVERKSIATSEDQCMLPGKGECRMGIEAERKSTAAPEDQCFAPRARADTENPIEENISLANRDAPFNMLEHLKGYFQFSQEEYARPFKRIVGGKDVTGTTTERTANNVSSDVDMEQRGGIGGTMKEGNDREVADRKTIIGESVFRNTAQEDLETRLLVTLSDAKEAIEWPNSALGKTQEEIERDLMLALLQSVRGGDSNAAVYWLARILENREGPLIAANALLKFASEEVGMADPQALVQAVACYQACQFLGMKGCSSHLTQCAVYLSMAPKSAALPQAFQSALKAVQNGHHDPVPSHLLRTSGGLEQEFGYLPASLQNLKFLRWPEI